MNVKVRAEQTGGGIEWTIDGKKPKESVHSFGHKSGPQKLHFDLDDGTGLGLRFAEDPIWVHENEDGQCPPTAGINTDQIEVSSVAPGKLSIDNQNSGAPRTLHYQLNFVDRSGTASNVDPVIKNGGGT